MQNPKSTIGCWLAVGGLFWVASCQTGDDYAELTDPGGTNVTSGPGSTTGSSSGTVGSGTTSGVTGSGTTSGSGGSGGSTGSSSSTGTGGCLHALAADACTGVAPWDSMQIWNEYHVGDLRVHNGALWNCHTPAWCQTEPGGPNSDLGWTKQATCSGTTGTSGSGGTTGTSTTSGAGGSVNCTTGSGGSGGASGSSGAGGSGGSSSTGCALDKLMDASTFANIFNVRCSGHQINPVYTYQGLCSALKTQGFTAFANSGDVKKDKRELAALFAHAGKETWFLHYTEQQGTSDPYRGRGPLQLSYQANYQGAGDYIGKNLVANPGLVATDAVVTWQSALWFWMVQSNSGAGGEGNPHRAMSVGNFGQTTRIINGGIECGAPNASACKRIELYLRYCQALGLTQSDCTSGITLTCWGGDQSTCAGLAPGDC